MAEHNFHPACCFSGISRSGEFDLGNCLGALNVSPMRRHRPVQSIY